MPDMWILLSICLKIPPQKRRIHYLQGCSGKLVSTYIYNEVWLFVRAFAGGAVLIALLQPASCEMRIGSFYCSPAAEEDFLIFCIGVAGLLVFAGIYRTNQGTLRNFLFLGIVIRGIVFAYLQLAPVFEKICYENPGVSCQILKKLKKIYKAVAIFL